MSITRLYERLGAPLTNNRWSWGAQRTSDGAVFLRVWQDRKRVVDGERYMLVDGRRGLPEDETNPGYRERLRHLDAIRAGAKCYLVMCIARDPDERPRVIEDFHDEDVFIGEGLFEIDGSIWVRVAGRVPVSEVAKPPITSR
jgi:hypothetical protein